MDRADKGLLTDIDYRIFDPTGNITALVETELETDMYPAVSAQIMRLHPEVEQVGFVSFDTAGREDSADREDEPASAELRMAGGEFCGNATMSAAALCLIHSDSSDADGFEKTVYVRASGVSEAVRVELRRREDTEYEASVLMPPALSIEESLVHMQGIDHIVVTQDSPLYKLSSQADSAEAVIRDLCRKNGSECLGMMFLIEDAGKFELKPLVYVPGVDTVFWENSCASGTAAVGMYLAARDGRKIDINVSEPAGTMRVTSDPGTGETWLSGTTRLIR